MNPTKARKAIREHKGIITVGIRGPIEWDVIITKKEATEIVKQAENNDLAILTSFHGGAEMVISIWEKKDIGEDDD